MKFGKRGTITFSAMPNTPLPPAGLPFSELLNYKAPKPELYPSSCLKISELSAHIGVCERTLREKIKANELRAHRVGDRQLIVWGEFLKDTEFH